MNYAFHSAGFEKLILANDMELLHKGAFTQAKVKQLVYNCPDVTLDIPDVLNSPFYMAQTQGKRRFGKCGRKGNGWFNGFFGRTKDDD